MCVTFLDQIIEVITFEPFLTIFRLHFLRQVEHLQKLVKLKTKQLLKTVTELSLLKSVKLTVLITMMVKVDGILQNGV